MKYIAVINEAGLCIDRIYVCKDVESAKKTFKELFQSYSADGFRDTDGSTWEDAFEMRGAYFKHKGVCLDVFSEKRIEKIS